MSEGVAVLSPPKRLGSLRCAGAFPPVPQAQLQPRLVRLIVASLQRSVVSSAVPFAPALFWRGGLVISLLSALLVLRACEYDIGLVAAYTGYLLAYVALPGVVAVAFVRRGPVSLTQVLALALPTGFALEIFSFLGCAALGLKSAYRWMPLLWVALAIGWHWRRGDWPVRLRVAANHSGIFCGLGLAFLGTAVMAASQMFAESPLAAGLPTRAIFHDWVYLVSRAGGIKNNWPLDDPSLSGTPLQYHYFMMVHAAAVSWTTGVELSAVMLRLAFFPLGAVLVAQAYALGRAVSRSAWGGVLAALLIVFASELSFAERYGRPMFLGIFVRWLFVSPTFFFGMIFCGALLLAVGDCARRARCDARRLGWLLLLGAAGTGAKGTMLPAILCALAIWAAWSGWTGRKLPWRIIGFGVLLAIAFLVVYLPTMSAWRTGDARLRPFHVFDLTEFWRLHLPGWRAWFAQWLPRALADPIATGLCAAVVFAGTCGVRLLAVPYLFWGDAARRNAPLVAWLGAFFVATTGMGMLLELNSYGELYVILMVRLPMSVLAAAFVVAAVRRLRAWRAARRESANRGDRHADLRATPAAPTRAGAVMLAAAMACAGVTLGLQTSLWWKRNSPGFAEWLRTPVDLKPDEHMATLQEALLWVRHNTERDAVLVPNAFTPENMRKDHWGALDRTLMGVHFYYSALSERRLWLEGPNYILDTARARLRASLAADFFYRGRPLPPRTVTRSACYVLVDRSLQDGARVPLARGSRVFANTRMEIYRLADAAAD